MRESPAALASHTPWGVIDPVAPFRLDLTAWALRRRAHNEIDRFDGGVYRRALRVGDRTIALSVIQSGSVDIPHLAVKVSDGCADQQADAIARDALDRLLGLSIDLSGFAVLAACDPVVSLLARELRGVKPPRFPTVFEALINAVACQQLSLAVGIHLLNRLTVNHGRPVPGDPTGVEGNRVQHDQGTHDHRQLEGDRRRHPQPRVAPRPR